MFSWELPGDAEVRKLHRLKNELLLLDCSGGLYSFCREEGRFALDGFGDDTVRFRKRAAADEMSENTWVWATAITYLTR